MSRKSAENRCLTLYEVCKMKITQKIMLNACAAALLLSISGCTLVGIGVVAYAGSGSTVGMVGGAVIGGVIGHEIGK